MYSYQNNFLHLGKSSLKEIHQQTINLLKKRYDYVGPYYLYSQDILLQRINQLEEILPLCHYYFSVKSCSNIKILSLLQKRKGWGVDVVSQGEMIRSLKAGFNPQQIVFAGVGKSEKEITFGISNRIRSFHVESVSELKKIEEISTGLNITTGVTLRVNPDIQVQTHKYIQTGQYESKFGISKEELALCKNLIKSSSSITLRGLQVHLGSQILSSEPYNKALDALIELREIFSDAGKIEYLSLGGGFGVDYSSTLDTDIIKEFPMQEISSNLSSYKDLPCEIMIEPGRYISAYTAVLMTTVLYIKKKQHTNIVIVDTGMTDLVRPVLYQSSHPILPLQIKSQEQMIVDIAGPICESGDVFARNITMNMIEEGDILSILHTGAYGASMASQYNTRCLLPEILWTQDGCEIIRRPQTYEHLLELENI